MLPIYDAIITNDEDGIIVMSLVDAPATEVNWMCFKHENERITLSVINEEEHILAGVVMTADQPIYRIAPTGEEYYIKFTKDVIKKMAEKMLSDNTFNNIDINHNGEILDSSKVKLVELFIKDESKGIAPNYLDVNDGSLLANYKIYDEELWQMAKNGELNGFSLEGYFSLEKDNNKNKNNKMSKIKELLKSLLTDFTEVETDKGVIIYDGELAVGTEVRTEEGDYVEDGEYVIDEKTIVIADGKVVEVKEKEVEEEEEEEVEEEVEAAEQVEEVVETEEPVEEDNRIEELQTKVSDLEERLKAIEELVKKINEETPVEPIEEQEFSKVVKSKNKAAEMAAYLNK